MKQVSSQAENAATETAKRRFDQSPEAPMGNDRPVRYDKAGRKGAFAHRSDAVLIFAVLLAAFLVFTRLNAFEAIYEFTRPYEFLQLDAFLLIAPMAALGLGWFSWRRYREAKNELLQRQAIESQLASALVDNQRLARRFIDTQETERRSLARELHDEMGQYLNAIKLDAVAIGRQTGPEATNRRVRGIVESVDHVHRAVQTLLRRLRPVALDELGLEAALEHSVSHWRARLPETHIELLADGAIENCGEVQNLAIYRIVQEALTNISRHARATRIRVELRRATATGGEDRIDLVIADDGTGIDMNTHQRGLGLIGMRERAEMLGGTLEIASSPGYGLSVHVMLPVGNSQK